MMMSATVLLLWRLEIATCIPGPSAGVEPLACRPTGCLAVKVIVPAPAVTATSAGATSTGLPPELAAVPFASV